ncbi:MAG: 3'-5' exonuclease [Mycoplasmataceae bacterium]|nr:3'-5' exonuclease [Mycoplasmataceae bacterium]
MELSLQNLNDKQLEAVKTTEGPVLVVAGAGSGKTKVLATRIAYLIDGIGCPDRNILAITFTNLACREMKSRVFSILNRPCNAQILTYHGLCLRILREDISIYGMDKNFNIIDDEEQSEIIKQIYQDWRLRDEFGKRCKIKMMLDFIRAIQSSCNCIERTFWDKNIDIPDQVNDLIKRHILHNGDDKYIKSIYLEYIKRKFKGNLLDYNDLITGAYKLLKYNPEIAKKWQQRFQYILVDEFQDTDYFQFQILQMLINSQENVFCVGDPDQTIYEWRGAYAEIFNDFLARFQNTKQIILDKNYRSTQNILDVANSLIKHNEKRIDKTLIAHNANGEKPIYYEGDSKNEEGRFVVNTIKELVKKGYAYKDIAILYRANFLSRFIEQALLYANIPYCIYGGVKFYQRKEIKDVLAYIRLIENPDDELAIKRVINTPNRKIGDVTIDKIANYAFNKNISFAEALKTSSSSDPNVTWDKENVRSFVALINSFKTLVKDLPLAEGVKKILEVIKYRNYLKTYDLNEETARWQNIEELLTSITQYSLDDEHPSYSSFLQSISLYTDTTSDDFKNKDENAVSLMTIHFAKGTEYKVVFIVGMYEGTFPNNRCEGNEEERRIAFVGFTRAKEHLYLCSSHGVSFNGSDEPSSFISEINPSSIEKKKSSLSSNSNADLSWFDSQKPQRFDNQYNNFSIDFKVGDTIVHTVFGMGQIVEVDGDYIVVVFKKPYGKKTLNAHHKAIKRVKN